MKANLAVAVLFGCALSALGQGTINFNNRATSGIPGPAVAPIFGIDPNDPYQPKTGNPATYATSPVPAGTQTYGGAPLVGTGYTAALWGVNVNVSDSVLTDPNAAPLSVVPFRVTTSPSVMGFWQPPALAPAVPGVVGGTTDRAKFIVRAWDNQGGTITSWAQILDAGQAGNYIPHGESLIFTVNAPLGLSPSIPPPNLVGLESFQIWQVPEPSSLIVTALGGSALVVPLLRRRNRG